MLVVTRHKGEAIKIQNSITIVYLGDGGDGRNGRDGGRRARIGIDAPSFLQVNREEIHARKEISPITNLRLSESDGEWSLSHLKTNESVSIPSSIAAEIEKFMEI